MDNTGYFQQDSRPQGLAIGYHQNDSTFSKATPWDISQSFSAAGAYSTTHDLLKWNQALRSDKLISSESLKEIFTPFSNQIKYGFAWYINDPVINGKKVLLAGHTGTANGYKAQIMRGVDENLLVIFLSNSAEYIELRYPIVETLLNEQN